MDITRYTESRTLARRTLALVLAGGRGSRLKDLTDRRAKPAVHFGGKFRIIDFALSNCMNSGMRRIGVITQYKSHSLLRHLQRGWSFLRNEMGEFVDLLPAQQRVDEESWYRGTADAIYQNLDIIRNSTPPEYIVVLAGDHIYKMDYSIMLADHAASGRGVTVGCIEVPREEAKGFGVMAIDENRAIVEFVEKPADPPPMPGDPNTSLASMGIYVFSADYLYRLLEEDAADPDSEHDFGKNLIPKAVSEGQALAHPFSMSAIANPPYSRAYWRDVGTVDAYWAANLDLASTTPELNMYDRDWPIWTYQEQLPPAKFVHDEPGRCGQAIDSLVSGGCIVSGATVRNSVLFSNVLVRSFSEINQAVVLPDVQIGRGCRLSKVVIDRRCRLPDGLVIGEDPELDAQRFFRTDNGVVLVTRRMIAAL
ncbi:glucose-1-phosphate adenylyltransferase [Sphaerotilus sulfidivorans]|jgi:glucose-1-phosphate adenylyltransferase|uniref:glucose-1-phosphate adenylyltransferase n=1 Tax=Sphaerotilus TaxID=34102 RepID=UPI001C815E1F|nr:MULTISPECIES: glucose-1-phosphate adenylyltransferase [Sphaerotilus]MCK6401160.1 glucose-1-phosphate adenylyltransferase [Sphaerotilus sulfidivorans]GIX53186.1 glucose-1-phosphate adenylyltransferase [Sphaerotilus natans]GKQ58424.1 glucose-1-phosphate adenylyltransferase [Sphaerotilus sp. FB-3]